MRLPLSDFQVIVSFFHLRLWPVTFMASFLIWVMIVALFALWVMDKRVDKEQIFHALLASFIALLISEAIKVWFPTLRPYKINHLPTFTFATPGDSSFPSEHSAVAFGLAASVWTHHRRLGIIFIFAAVLVGVGRVLGNVHYYTDIIGGAILGIVSVIILEKLHVALQPKVGRKR